MDIKALEQTVSCALGLGLFIFVFAMSPELGFGIIFTMLIVFFFVCVYHIFKENNANKVNKRTKADIVRRMEHRRGRYTEKASQAPKIDTEKSIK